MMNSTGLTASTSSHHVKFNLEENEIKSHHENLEIVKATEDANDLTYNVHLGYLKVDHHYRVTFSLNIKHDELADSSQFTFLGQRSSKHITLKEFSIEPNGLCTFTFIFFAYKEKFEIQHALFSVDNTDKTRIAFNIDARVLGANQGTPLLRNGITLLHNSHPQDAAKSHFNIN